jgi:DNA-directed RNA polymerase specialized sigma24 family protein
MDDTDTNNAFDESADAELPALSPFDALEETFRLLSVGPRPLCLDGREVSGLPAREIPLLELRSMLLHPSVAYPVRDAALGALVARAQAEGGRWSVGIAGVLLPGIRRAVFPLFEACPTKGADLEAEALCGFLGALARCEVGRARVASWLCWRTRIGAAKVLRAELAERAGPGTTPVSAAPPRPWGHPDLVLAKVVAAGVISAEDAELIWATRLEHQSLAEAAEGLGISYKTCHKRRARAEAALADFLRSDWYSPYDFVEKRPETPCFSRRGRPRTGRGTDRRPGKRPSTPRSPRR